jgi:predicted protein tyrosine phosphatase
MFWKVGGKNGPLLASFGQFFFQAIAFSDIHRVKLLELVQQFLRHSRVVTVTFPLAYDFTLMGNMPLGFGDMAPSLIQMVQNRVSIFHVRNASK